MPRLVVFFVLLASGALHAQTVDRSAMTGQQLYDAACAACHGRDGRGADPAVRGFDLDLPDFTDCALTTAEADLDWYSVIHQGGRVRAFDRMMPAFGDALDAAQIERVISFVRGFCRERGWPHGDLNLPRALVTEKAFPENEAVVTAALGRGEGRAVVTEFLYERRLGRRGQYEIFARDIDEIGAAYKHVVFDSHARGSILSAGGEVKGRDDGAVFEAFGAFSQTLPFVPDGFLHAHAGIEAPTAAASSNEAFWRAAIGRTFSSAPWSRAWSPMVELLAARELESGARTSWDVLPQMQVSLSTRQHVLINAGLRVPLTDRAARRTTVLVYLLWDWFDGGFLSGW